MTSNDDLMSFLLQMEEKRASEREADKQEFREIRVREREEDKQAMIEVIDSSIGEKVAEAVAPFRDKTEGVVQVQAQMKEQVDMLMKEMKTLKGKVDSTVSEARSTPSGLTMAAVISGREQQAVQGVVQGSGGQGGGGQGGAGHGGGIQLSEGHGGWGLGGGSGGQGQDQLGPIISLGRRTVGLHKIDKDDLNRMRQAQYGGAENEEEEKVLAAKEFLMFEMKFDRETIDRMEVEKVFLPAKENPQCLYVTFKH
jgi:hypothetical protein